MYRKTFILCIVLAAILALSSIGFAMWGIIGEQNGETSGDFISYTIIDLENVTNEEPAFYYNNYGFYDGVSYSYETSFTIQITAPLKESAYDLSITLIDQDDFLSTSTITSSANRNSEVGTKTILIEDINIGSTFNVSFTITSDSSNYSAIFSNLSSKIISLKITASTDDGIWTIDKTIILQAHVQNLISIAKPVANTGLVYNGTSQILVNSGTGYTLSGEAQTNAGNYSVTATLENGYCWSDNDSNTTISISASISQIVVGISWSNTSLTYNMSSQAPNATATGVLNGDIVNVVVTGSQTDAGTYTATASSVDNINYTLIGSSGLTTSFTIAKATPTVDFAFKKSV